MVKHEEPLGTRSLARLRLLPSNSRMVDARLVLGYTQGELASKTDFSKQRIHEIEALWRVPTDEEMIRIAVVLGKPIDYLFPEALLNAVEAKVFLRRKAELQEPQIISLTEARRHLLITNGDIEECEKRVDQKHLRQVVDDILDSLEPWEATVIRERFGLNEDGEAKTLGEAAAITKSKFGRTVTRERIRQIESRALRKLRHTSRGKKLKLFID